MSPALALAVAGIARGEGPGPAELLREARAAEADGRWEEVVERCTALVARFADRKEAGTCARRLASLDRRRDDDGTLHAFEVLDEVRRTYASTGAAPDAVVRDRVAQLWLSRATPQVVKAEAAVWLAREEMDDDPGRAVVHTQPWLRSEVPGEPELTRQVRQLQAVALARVGRDDDAHEVQEAVRVPVDPAGARLTPVDLVVRDRRRRAGAWVSAGVVAGFGGIVVSRVRRVERFAPLGLGVLAATTAGAAGLAWGWSPEAARAIGWIGVALGLVHVASALALRSTRGSARWTWAVRVSAAAASVAVVYGGLWWCALLDSVGL